MLPLTRLMGLRPTKPVAKTPWPPPHPGCRCTAVIAIAVKKGERGGGEGPPRCKRDKQGRACTFHGAAQLGSPGKSVGGILAGRSREREATTYATHKPRSPPAPRRAAAAKAREKQTAAESWSSQAIKE